MEREEVQKREIQDCKEMETPEKGNNRNCQYVHAASKGCNDTTTVKTVREEEEQSQYGARF